MSRPLLEQIAEAAKAKDEGDPNAAVRLARLIEKLKKQGVAGMRRPNPPRTIREDD